MRCETLDIGVAQQLGHCSHCRAFTRPGLISPQHVFQIVHALRCQRRQPRIGAVAVYPVAAVAALCQFLGRQRLAYIGWLRLLVRVERRNVFHRALVERRNQRLHGLIAARTFLVGAQRGGDVLRVLTRKTRIRGIRADALLAVTTGAGGGSGLA